MRLCLPSPTSPLTSQSSFSAHYRVGHRLTHPVTLTCPSNIRGAHQLSWTQRMALPLAPIIGNSFATILLTKSSMANHPGGQALAIFHQSIQHSTHPPLHIHISNLAAQSGASLFFQLHSSSNYHHRPLSNTHDEWIYNKAKNLTIHPQP